MRTSFELWTGVDDMILLCTKKSVLSQFLLQGLRIKDFLSTQKMQFESAFCYSLTQTVTHNFLLIMRVQ